MSELPTMPPADGNDGNQGATVKRMRRRAQTDLHLLHSQYQRHDIFVILLALIILVVAGRIHRRLVTPPNVVFAERGLTFLRAASWVKPEAVPAVAPRLVRTWSDQTDKAPYHVVFSTPLDPSARLEVFIDDKPTWSNVVTGLEFDRRARWGELYTLVGSQVRSIDGHDWLRTTYRYAYSNGKEPAIGTAVEYATVDLQRIYAVTFFGSSKAIARMESVTAPSLRTESRIGLPLVPQVTRASKATKNTEVAKAFASTAMVVVADVVGSRLVVRGGGSGVIVSADGSLVTNYHVLHDRGGRLHDVFVVAQSDRPDYAPTLLCAGSPNRSKFSAELDLALIKCDSDLDGRQWNPRSMQWQPIKQGKAAALSPGTQLWVLGYPDVGGGGLQVSQGAIEGVTGTPGAPPDFIKTDAAITHGNSGGPVINGQGEFIGIATAFRTELASDGTTVEVSKIGLVRPVASASQLLAIAQAGWTPREGRNAVTLEPVAVEATAEGVRLSTTITDFANAAPIADAMVFVLRPGLKGSAIDMNRLDDQVLAWGKSNAAGEVTLKQPVPVPGTYSVVVFAQGYQTLFGDDQLKLAEDTPAYFDPWGGVTLLAR